MLDASCNCFPYAFDWLDAAVHKSNQLYLDFVQAFVIKVFWRRLACDSEYQIAERRKEIVWAEDGCLQWEEEGSEAESKGWRENRNTFALDFFKLLQTDSIFHTHGTSISQYWSLHLAFIQESIVRYIPRSTNAHYKCNSKVNKRTRSDMIKSTGHPIATFDCSTLSET